MHKVSFVFAVVAAALAPVSAAHAYIDPGTGSMLLQALLAIVAGAAIGVRTYWFKIKQLFSRKNDDHE
jgi:Uncharacterized protein conserved in bacteria